MNFSKSISYLGHVVTEEAVRTDPKKIEAIKKWPRPHNVHTVRRFLGFTNYYRKFIKDYSKIARPLYNLISGDNAKRRTNPVEWSQGAEEAFQTLIERCTNTPILTNIDADALSRLTCLEQIDNEEVQAILKGCLEQPKFLWEAYGCSARVTEDLQQNLAPSKMGIPEWRKAQALDPAISAIKKMISNKTLSQRRPTSRDEPEIRAYLHQRLRLRNGILYRYIDTSQRPDRNNMQLCLPKPYRKEALEGCHDNVGHFGIDRTLDLLRDRFYWPHLMEEAKDYVSSCRRCQMAKGRQQLAPLQPYHADAPMELVHMDYLTIEHGRTGNDVNILIITDHYSTFAQAIKTTNQTALTTAQAAYDHFFSKYGFPEKIVTDQGTNFESLLFKDLCKVANITKLRTTSYHP